MNNHNKNHPLPEGFTVTAHTGCEGTPDNSLESIRVGAQNADIVEVDLNFTKNNEPVLAHDFIKSSAPTIDEAFAALAEFENVKMNIDVKIAPNLKAVYESAKKHGVENRIFYTGIEKAKVKAAQNDTPEVPYYLNVTVTRFQMLKPGYIDFLVSEVKKAGAIGLNMSFRPCNHKLIEAFHKEGLLVSLWTCNTEKDMLKALKLGPDNITTRNPKKLRSIIGR